MGTLILGVGLVAAVVLAALLSFVWTPYDPTVVDSGAAAASERPTLAGH